MRMPRPDRAKLIADLIGASVQLSEARDGWPSMVRMRVDGEWGEVALHVSGASPHARKPWEWRFQNPGATPPVIAPGRSLPMLVGLDEIQGRPVLIAVDGRSRLGSTARFSILFDKRISEEAAVSGWSEQVSTTGERIFACWPRLFPLVVAIVLTGVDVDAKDVATAANASGLLDNGGEEAGERARRSIYARVRDARFSDDVRQAYGHRCAMCELALGLVAGAHIYPVSAPQSPDQVWNGLSLCHNHHAAFDAHQIWIGRDYRIMISERYHNSARVDAAADHFVRGTRQILLIPQSIAAQPSHDMLERRYNYFGDAYEWAPVF